MIDTSKSSPPPPPGGMPPPPPPDWNAAGGGPGGAGGPGGVSENRQVFLVLSYLSLLALIPYFMEKNDREVQWHAKHGLVLTGAELLFSIVLGTVFGVISFVLPILGCLLPLFGLVMTLAFLGLHIYCIVKALNGERLLIPGISKFADQF